MLAPRRRLPRSPSGRFPSPGPRPPSTCSTPSSRSDSAEADEFYATVIPQISVRRRRAVMRQSLAGLLWSKQFYHYVVQDWLDGDPAQPAPPTERRHGRNHEWAHLLQRRRHLDAGQVGVPVVRGVGSRVPLRAARAGRRRLRQGAARADAARVVHASRTASCPPTSGPSATSTRRCTRGPPGASTRSSRSARGVGDRVFLERVFHKLLLNFTWWVNRKDAEGSNVFEGGFLGLDNIGVFDRSPPLPTGGYLEQSDGTSWMAMYSPEPARHRAGTGARRPRLRGRRQQVLGALPLHRPRDGPPGQGQEPQPVGRGGRLLLRHPPPRPDGATSSR